MRRLLLALAAACTTPHTSSITPTKEPIMNYADINGLHLYYEIHGSGEPLIVLHGALRSTAEFGPTLDALAAHRQVIAVDLQAHGRTADIDRPMTFEAMADDVAALIDHLKLGKADVMGYSLGGGVALQTGIRHADKVRRLVLVSTVFARADWFPEVRTGMEHLGPALAEMMKPSPVYQTYAKVAPRPDFGGLLGRVGTLMRQDYDWSGQVGQLPPTLLVVGDADGIDPTHLVGMWRALGGGLRDPGWDGSGGRSASQLAILPGVTHYDMPTTPALAPTVARFLAVR